MKIYSPPPTPKETIRVSITNRQTKENTYMTFVGANLGEAYKIMNDLFAEYTGTPLTTIQLRMQVNHIPGKSVSFAVPIEVEDVINVITNSFEKCQ
jgi:hypothetical protein